MCRTCPIPCRALAYLGGFACTTPEYLCDVQVSQFDQVGVTAKTKAEVFACVCVCIAFPIHYWDQSHMAILHLRLGQYIRWFGYVRLTRYILTVLSYQM